MEGLIPQFNQKLNEIALDYVQRFPVNGLFSEITYDWLNPFENYHLRSMLREINEITTLFKDLPEYHREINQIIDNISYIINYHLPTYNLIRCTFCNSPNHTGINYNLIIRPSMLYCFSNPQIKEIKACHNATHGSLTTDLMGNFVCNKCSSLRFRISFRASQEA